MVKEIGQLVLDDVPDIPDKIKERTLQYQNTRLAIIQDWVPAEFGGGLLVLTRFAETAQVHHVSGPGMARRQITFFNEPLHNVRMCPNTSLHPGFTFMKDKGGNEFYQFFTFDLKTGVSKMFTDGKSRNDSYKWNNKGDCAAFTSTKRNGKDWDLYIANTAALETHVSILQRGGGLWTVSDWSADDTQLLVRRYNSVNESYLFIFDLLQKDLSQINEKPPGAEKISYHVARWDLTPGKRGVFFTSDEGTDFVKLRYINLETGEIKVLTDFIDWDVESFEIARFEDGSILGAFTANEDGISQLYLLDVLTHEIKKVDNIPIGVISGLHFNKHDKVNKSLGMTINAAITPGDVYVLSIKSLSSTTIQQWTFSEVGGLPKDLFTAPELIKYPSFDGRKIPAFFYTPKKVEGKVPVVIQIHGGPESQTRPNFNSTFQFLLAEMGVAVLDPNVRGSAGYPTCFREDSVKDIGALLDWIKTQPQLDSERVAVMGGSYGGYMVLASLIHFGDRLRCGVESVGISNFVTFLENTQDYRRDLRREEYGDERDPKMREFLLNISPTTSAHKINKPLYVAQGLNDPRVPKSEADQIVEAVRKNGKQVWYVMAKDEGHGFIKKFNRDFHLNALLFFLETHL